jgi:hypothetical protein
MIIAQGPNFTITLIAGAAVYVVLPRPDLSREETAQIVSASSAHIQTLCDREDVRGLILDQRKVEGTPGPKTSQVISASLATFERKPKPVALLIHERPVLRMLMTRLASESAPTQARVVTSISNAHLWLSGIDPSPKVID